MLGTYGISKEIPKFITYLYHDGGGTQGKEGAEEGAPDEADVPHNRKRKVRGK
jgi:hypothetical protein